MTTKIRNIIAIVLGLIALGTAGYGGVCYFATAESVIVVNSKVDALQNQFDINRLVIFRDKIQEQIWKTEDRIRATSWDDSLRPELHRLKLQLQDIDRQLQQLMQGG